VATAPAAGTARPTQDQRQRLLLLDGHSLAYRAFFALPVENFATTTGQPTNAVYGFTSMLINVLAQEKPTHVAVAFDLSGPTFRHEAYTEYKATRSERTSPTVQLTGGFELIEPAQRCHNTLPNLSVDPMPFHQLHVFVQLVASPDSLDSWIHEWHNDSA